MASDMPSKKPWHSLIFAAQPMDLGEGSKVWTLFMCKTIEPSKR